MKNLKWIIVIIVIIVLVGAFVFWLGARKGIGPGEKQTEESAQVSKPEETKPEIKYATFSYDQGRFSFKYPDSWIKIAPEEIEKALTEEERQKEEILFYASSPEGVIISAALEDQARGDKSLDGIIEESLAELKKADPDMTIFADERKENEVSLGIDFRIQGRDWSNIGIIILAETNKTDHFYSVAITLPKELRDKYYDVGAYVLSSIRVQY